MAAVNVIVRESLANIASQYFPVPLEFGSPLHFRYRLRGSAPIFTVIPVPVTHGRQIAIHWTMLTTNRAYDELWSTTKNISSTDLKYLM